MLHYQQPSTADARKTIRYIIPPSHFGRISVLLIFLCMHISLLGVSALTASHQANNSIRQTMHYKNNHRYLNE